MATFHHFVVAGLVNDDGSVSFSISDTVADAHFSDGLIYDDDAGEWRRVGKDTESNDRRLSDELATLLNGDKS